MAVSNRFTAHLETGPFNVGLHVGGALSAITNLATRALSNPIETLTSAFHSPSRFSFFPPARLISVTGVLSLSMLQVSRYGVQAQPTFLTTLRLSDENVALAVTKTSDDTIVLGGYTRSVGGEEDALVIKYWLNGTKVWVEALEGSNEDYFYALASVFDGGVVAGGYTTSSGAGNTDALLVRLLPNGEKAWIQTLGGSNSDNIKAVTLTPDGGIIAGGGTASFGSGSWDCLLTKLWLNGTKAWVKVLGENGAEYIHALEKTSDGGIIAAGLTTSFGGANFLLTKCGSDGSLAWTRILGGNDEDEAWAITVGVDGGIFIGGATKNFGSGDTNALLAKYSFEGNLEWASVFVGPGYNLISSLKALPDGGVIAAGQTSGDALLAKVWPNGTLEFNSAIGANESYYVYSVVTAPNDEIIIAGQVYGKTLLARLTSEGKIQNCEHVKEATSTLFNITSIINTESRSPTTQDWDSCLIQVWNSVSVNPVNSNEMEQCRSPVTTGLVTTGQWASTTGSATTGQESSMSSPVAVTTGAGATSGGVVTTGVVTTGLSSTGLESSMSSPATPGGGSTGVATSGFLTTAYVPYFDAESTSSETSYVGMSVGITIGVGGFIFLIGSAVAGYCVGKKERAKRLAMLELRSVSTPGGYNAQMGREVGPHHQQYGDAGASKGPYSEPIASTGYGFDVTSYQPALDVYGVPIQPTAHYVPAPPREDAGREGEVYVAGMDREVGLQHGQGLYGTSNGSNNN